MKTLYKQESIYTALQSAKKPVSGPEIVGGSCVTPSKDTKIKYYCWPQLPENCYKCACSRVWKTDDGKVIACRISGNHDLADVQGGKCRREDCQMEVLNK